MNFAAGANSTAWVSLSGVCSDSAGSSSTGTPYHPKTSFQIQPVDRAQGIQPENGRNRSLVLDIRQTAERDCKLVAGAPLRNLLAGLFDVAVRELQPLASMLELFPRALHDMIPLDACRGLPAVPKRAAHRAKIIASRLPRKQEKETDFVLKTEH